MSAVLEDIAARIRVLLPTQADWSVRLVDDYEQHLHVWRSVSQPPAWQQRRGAFISCNENGSLAYAATSDLTDTGLRLAYARARQLARQLQARQLFPCPAGIGPHQHGHYETTVKQPWASREFRDLSDWLQRLNTSLHQHQAIVDWSAALTWRHTDMLLIGPDATVKQAFDFISPHLSASACRHNETQTRSFGYDHAAQAGLEHLDLLDLDSAAIRISTEAVELLDADDCPDTCCDLLLMPGQMILQIHESIGHPLELDRILGDERNYAGSSFVSLDMFGHYQYGSELLNVVFDPHHSGELASYAFDDSGSVARREYLIRDGILTRPLGSAMSQQRAGLAGVANARSSGWNRPPIDRMANINIEPGNQSLANMISGIEHGVLMDTNR
ncbi:MAG: TldD/PmbA family protein, partial [Gammaproteobacteria bacterium]